MLFDEFSKKEKGVMISVLIVLLLSGNFYVRFNYSLRTANDPEFAKAVIGERGSVSKSRFLNYSFRDNYNSTYHGTLGTTWRRVKLTKDSSYWAVYYKCDPRISTILEDIPPHYTKKQVQETVTKQKIRWEIGLDRHPVILQLRSCKESGEPEFYHKY